MIELHETDFVALGDFPLRWRFADAQYGQMSPDLLRRIRPLSSRAAALFVEVSKRLAERVVAPIRLDAAKDHESARSWLRSLPPMPGTVVFVSWDRDTAAVTEWAVFTAHWDDFCYPASDDVAVWAPDGGWLLQYHHSARFEFWSAPRAA